MNEIENKLVDILCDTLKCGYPRELYTSQTSLLEEVGLDSLQLIQFIVAIEGELGIAIFDEDISPDLFTELHKLATYVAGKLR